MSLKLAVFDVGGVLIRICHTWEDAARLAEVKIANSDPGTLGKCPFLDRYQDGTSTVEEYLESLRAHLGLDSSEEALRVHNHILVEEYPGMKDLVLCLKEQGVSTACLSNTAQLHWDEMGHSGRFPAFEALDFHFASHIEKLNKPHPEVYRRVEEATGFTQESVIFFDDYERNVEGAKAVGWNALRVDPEESPFEQISKKLADFGLKCISAR
jgi:FMN phosphatase YigB (HAD superfamily)